MRSITIHPASLALGVVFGGICLLSMSQFTTAMPLRVEYLAHPKDMVQIHAGTPYVVPTGKVFALTALGENGTSSGSLVPLVVNGQQEITSNPMGFANGNSLTAVPAGFTVPAGSTIEVDPSHSGSPGRAWGYLVNQQ